MAKDPAFLFYYQDFLVGTSFMTLEEVGAYIKLLCFQAAKGPLTEDDILKKIPKKIWESIKDNFSLKDGVYSNSRLSQEIDKRKKFIEHQRLNSHMRWDKVGKGLAIPLENENENENNKDKDNEKHNVIISNNNIKRSFSFDDFWNKYPKQVGMSIALQTFLATVKTDRDFEELMAALENYKKSKEFKDGYIKNGSNWIEDWRGWIPKKPAKRVIAPPKKEEPFIPPTAEDRAKLKAVAAGIGAIK